MYKHKTDSTKAAEYRPALELPVESCRSLALRDIHRGVNVGMDLVVTGFADERIFLAVSPLTTPIAGLTRPIRINELNRNTGRPSLVFDIPLEFVIRLIVDGVIGGLSVPSKVFEANPAGIVFKRKVNDLLRGRVQYPVSIAFDVTFACFDSSEIALSA